MSERESSKRTKAGRDLVSRITAALVGRALWVVIVEFFRHDL
ncbi:hypothetical protein ACWGH2_26085 [Streptomyces sp. NPDC054871]